ncbi:hypothetical protein [Thauera sp. 2A1]|uniref:hypothetical protein n=1 Tax=Thauera sp. 2A1 TaxID=2570191 RepID=UPI001290B52F|nr:hypothetical protein [Thauera sp. 2A1]KAI5914628.1 hypothetical protein GH664_11825 [Thauera sp. 2A1]
MALTWTPRTIAGLAGNWVRAMARHGTRTILVGNAGALYTSTDHVTWTARDSQHADADLYGVASSGSVAVVVGEGWGAPLGRIASSVDGIAWTARTSPLAVPFASVAYRNGLFLAGTTNSRVVTSADGATWSAASSVVEADNWVNGFAYGNGMYVARRDYGIMSSPTGASWTLRVSSYDYSISDLIFAGGQFVAVGSFGTVLRSSDGITWTVGALGASGMAYCLTYVDGVYIAAGDAGRIWTSTDAVTWTSQIVATANYRSWGLIAASAAAVVVAGSDGHIAYSLDAGATWATQDAAFAAVGINALIEVDGVFVAAADDVIGVSELDAGAPQVTLPITISVVAAGERVTLPVRLSAVAPAARALPLRISVIDGAAVGGLDGAAGWAAAPAGAWRPVVTLDGADISDRLLGAVTVTHSRDAAAVAEFALLPASPLQPLSLIGRRVTVSFARADGSAVQRMFTGVVDVPRIDLATGAITLSCHDQAQEVWSNTPREAIDALVGGRWSLAVSGEPADNHAYLLERIQSRGASWALDVLQSPRIVPWGAGSRTLTVRTADVLDESVSVDLPSREQLRTRVACRLQYRYTRLRYRGATAQWAQDISFFKPQVTATQSYPGSAFLTTAMVQSACESVSGWDLVGTPRIEHPPARSWQIGDTIASGFFTIDAVTAPALAMSFSATYSTRWRQVVTEDYAVTVVCPSLETQIGAPVGEEIGATLESAFDQPDWERDPSLEPMLSNTYGAGDMHEDWQPAGFDPAARDEALRTLLDRAWVRLWRASRSGRVSFGVPLRPDIWLDTRIVLEHARLRASGDVQEVTHTMDPGSGHAISTLTLAVGMPGAASAAHPAWSLPASPADGYVPPLAAHSFEIGTYVGGQIGSPPFNETTMIGFTTNLSGPSVAGRNYYPHQLSMRAPDVAPEDRNPLDLPAVAQIDVAIPTDTLEVS